MRLHSYAPFLERMLTNLDSGRSTLMSISWPQIPITTGWTKGMMCKGSAPRLVLGFENQAIKAVNERNRARRTLENRECERLNAIPCLATFAHERVMQSVLLVQSAPSEALRADRFRTMRNYPIELLDLTGLEKTLRRQLKPPVSRAHKTGLQNERAMIGERDADHAPVKEHIRILLAKPERRDDTAAELWPHWICRLRELGCEPVELTDERGRPFLEYDFPRARNKRNTDGQPIRTMTFRRFQNIVSALRRSRYPLRTSTPLSYQHCSRRQFSTVLIEADETRGHRRPSILRVRPLEQLPGVVIQVAEAFGLNPISDDRKQ
jgi:hypothetical protein